MYIYICIYIYVCIYVCIYIYIICMNIWIHVYMIMYVWTIYDPYILRCVCACYHSYLPINKNQHPHLAFKQLNAHILQSTSSAPILFLSTNSAFTPFPEPT